MVLRKAWAAAGTAGLVGLSFMGLIAVGTYAAAGPVGAGGTLALAPGTVPAAYQGLIQKWGTRCPELSAPLLAAQLYQESGFNPSAVSPAKAYGIAQFLLSTWAGHGVDGDGDGDKDIWDPADAIPAAAAYDCHLADRVRAVPGDKVSNMLAAYNAGEGAVIANGGVPPYPETQGYVKRIRSLAASFTAVTSPIGYSAQASGAIYFAQSKLGTPYLWGGEGLPSQGGRFDCSGLTQAAYATVGITLPRVANDQWYAGEHPARDQLRPGDLVFFAHNLTDPRTIHHVGIYVGGGYMINAPHTGAVIRYDKIDTPDYIGATRVTSDGAAALPARGSDGTIANGAGPQPTPTTRN